MRRAFVGREWWRAFAVHGYAFAQRFHFPAEPGKFIALLQHGFVLLRNVALEPGNPFFDVLKRGIVHAPSSPEMPCGVNHACGSVEQQRVVGMVLPAAWMVFCRSGSTMRL